MKNLVNKIFILLVVCTLSCNIANAKDNAQKDNSIRKERNYIREGNDAYRKGNIKDAYVLYQKALHENPESNVAKHNIGLTLIKQATKDDKLDDPKSPLAEGLQMMNNAAHNTHDKKLAASAYYNIGNVYFHSEKYQESIEAYKACLRRTPDDDKARENLRLAQKKLQEQQQNQDKNQDKKDDKKDQDKDKDQDKKEDKKDDQKDNKQNENNDDKQQQQQQPQPQGNQEQMLKAVADKEKETQQRINSQQQNSEQRKRRSTEHEW